MILLIWEYSLRALYHIFLKAKSDSDSNTETAIASWLSTKEEFMRDGIIMWVIVMLPAFIYQGRITKKKVD